MKHVLAPLTISACLLLVTINPEARFKVQRGPASARLQQAGFTPVLVKIINQSASTPELRIFSPQAGQVYAGSTTSPTMTNGQASSNAVSQYDIACLQVTTQVP